MKTQDPIYLEFDLEDTRVDLSKPFDYNTLLYTVVNEGNQLPTKENSLYLPIDKHWFTEIIEGRKDKEYREIKDTTVSRYLDLQQTKDSVLIRDDAPEDMKLDILMFNNGYFPFFPRAYAYLKLAVGYSKDRAWAVIELKAISFEPFMDKEGNIIRYTFDENVSDEDALIPDGEGTWWNMVYHLGKIVEYHPKGEIL